MLDSVDTVLFYANDHAYFFKGDRYLKYSPGSGLVWNGGRVDRSIGITGWKSFPNSFRGDLDVAITYSNGHVYFFKGAEYVKYKPGEGVVKSNGNEIRQIGITGWKSFSDNFRSDLGAALMYSNGHAYFFKSSEYIKYEPGEGLVATTKPADKGSKCAARWNLETGELTNLD